MKNESLKSIDMYCRVDQLFSSGTLYYDAYPINSASKNKSVASDWAKRGSGEGKVFTVNNEVGFTNLRLITLSIRSQGGRAYKVVFEAEGNHFMVDMREESLIHIMKTGTVAKGIIYGQFTFIQNGSQIRIVSMESKEFLTFKENSKVTEGRTKVSDKKIIANTIYKLGKTKGAYTLYLGKSYVSDVINQFNPDALNGALTIPELGVYIDFDYSKSTGFSLVNQFISTNYYKSRSLHSITEGELGHEFTPENILNKMKTLIDPQYFVRYSLKNKVKLTEFLNTYKSKIKGIGFGFFSRSGKQKSIGLEMNEIYNRLVESYGR